MTNDTPRASKPRPASSGRWALAEGGRPLPKTWEKLTPPFSISVPFSITRVRPPPPAGRVQASSTRSEEHTSELQSLMRHSYAVFCSKKKKKTYTNPKHHKTKLIYINLLKTWNSNTFNDNSFYRVVQQSID